MKRWEGHVVFMEDEKSLENFVECCSCHFMLEVPDMFRKVVICMPNVGQIYISNVL